MLKKGLAFLLLSALLLIVGQAALADTCQVSYSVVFMQSGCREMLQMINDFRTGSDAWYWDSDNVTEIWPEGLEELVYDYDLEQVAMQRAAECALHYSHTRPDNTRCFTAFTPDGIWARGENIAAGYNSNSTPEQAFVGWREDDKPYAGQGHRRNMLNPNFNCVGIGHVQYGDCHFWAQALAKRDSPNTAVTPANNQCTVVYVTVSSDLFAESSAGSLTVSALNIEYADMAELPGVTAFLRMTEQWPSEYRDADEVTLYPAWTSADPACVEISGVQALGKAVGQTTLTASVLGESCSLPASVSFSALLTPDYVLPAYLTAIDTESFSNTGVSAVVIPDSVRSIGSKAFSACRNLRQITIPDAVTQIAGDAFDSCRGDLVILCRAGSKAEEVALLRGISIVYLQ